jgi:hypothetical protein
MAFKKLPKGDDLPSACLHRTLHDVDVGANVELALAHVLINSVEPALSHGCVKCGDSEVRTACN